MLSTTEAVWKWKADEANILFEEMLELGEQGQYLEKR